MAYVKNTTFLNRPKKNFMKEFLPIKTLNPSAKIIFMYIVSKPDEWHLNYTDISNNTAINRSTVTDNMKYLVNHGYISMSSKGLETYYSINCYPETEPKTPITCTEFTHTEKPHTRKSTKTDSNKAITKSTSYTEKPHTEKPYDINIDNRNIDIRIDNKDINKKINNKKDGELMSYESTVKLMRDRLVYSGKVENLIKEFGIEEVNKHLRYLDYFELDKTHQNYKKNLTFAFLESLRNNLPEPQALKKINSSISENKRSEKLKPIKEYFNIKSKSNIDTVTYLFKKLVSMKENYKTNLNSFQKELISLTNNNRKILKQDELSLKEKTKLIEDSVKSYYKQRTQIITDCIFLKDYIDILTLFQIILGGNQVSLQSLKLVSINNLDKEIQKLKIFILTTSQDSLEECKEWTNLQEG